MLVHVKMPFTSGLKADDGAMLAVICAVRLNDADVPQPMMLGEVPEGFGNLLASSFFAFFTRTDVNDLSGRVLFAHKRVVNME